MPKTFTFKEYQRTYFPNEILQRLEETLCSELGLKEPDQHFLSTDKNNQKTGFLEVDKHNGYLSKSLKDINKSIELFYKKEGYNVSTTKNGSIEAKKRKEDYWIIVTEGDKSYNVSILNSPLRSFNLN